MPIAPSQHRCTIFDIRGTHGSGKSWLVHKLLETYGDCPQYDGSKLIGHDLTHIPVSIVGPYNRVCGGCDAIKDPNEVGERVTSFARRARVVVFEGILVAHTFKRYSELADRLEKQGHEYVFLFLNTPEDECIRRVEERRKTKGNEKPLNTYWLKYDYKRINHRTGSIQEKCLMAGHSTQMLPWQEAWPVFKGLVEEAVKKKNPR